MIGRTNTGGCGGGGLNFQVVGGTTVPNNTKENMIWVNTSTAITDYIFSATQPSSVNGRVWISTGTSSEAEFNALKKNSIQVYPISAKQYVSGAWVNKVAKSYLNGKWVEWWDGTLYDTGNQVEYITGGWEKNSAMNFASSPNTGTATFNASNVYLVSPKNTSAIISTKNKVNIDTSRFSFLKFDITVGGYTGNDGYGITDKHGNVHADFVASASATVSVGTRTTIQVPISNVPTGDYYVYAAVSSERQRYVHKIWLE